MATRFRVCVCAIAFLGVSLPAAHGQHKRVMGYLPTAPVDVDWEYYNLNSGGPHITLHQAGHAHAHHKPALAFYSPQPAQYDPVNGHTRTQPYHPGFGYGWVGPRAASPRPRVTTVNTHPMASPVVDHGHHRLRLFVKVPHQGVHLAFKDGPTADMGTGTQRLFESPDLAPGQSYTYTLVATWKEQGLTRVESRTVVGKAGDTVTADFTR